MILNVVAIYDSRVQTFMVPSFVHHTAGSVRAFRDLVGDPSSEPAKHPEDYELYHLATYDDSTGFLKPLDDGPFRLARAIDFTSQD